MLISHEDWVRVHIKMNLTGDQSYGGLTAAPVKKAQAKAPVQQQVRVGKSYTENFYLEAKMFLYFLILFHSLFYFTVVNFMSYKILLLYLINLI